MPSPGWARTGTGRKTLGESTGRDQRDRKANVPHFSLLQTNIKETGATMSNSQVLEPPKVEISEFYFSLVEEFTREVEIAELYAIYPWIEAVLPSPEWLNEAFCFTWGDDFCRTKLTQAGRNNGLPF